MREVGQQLFFAGDDVAQFKHAGLRFGIINAVNEALFPGDEHQGLLAGHIRHHQRGENIIARAPVIFQRGEQLVLAFPELVETDLLDLRDAEGVAVFLVFLGVGGDGLRRGLEREQRAGGKELLREFARVDPGDFFQARENFTVACGRRGRGEVQRVGHQAGQQQAGDGLGQFHVLPEKTVGDNRARGADGFVAEQDRLLRRQRAEAMVVNDLDDLHFVRALHGLREFVVIHENQFALDPLEKVGLGQNADRATLGIRDGKHGEARGRRLGADGAQRRVFAEGEKFLVDHVADGHRRAAKRRRGERVVRRRDDAHMILFGDLDDVRRNGRLAGHDQNAHPFADGHFLNIRAVADDHRQFVELKIFQPLREGCNRHRADHQGQFLLTV